jgi:hypothetical protein
MPYVKKPIWVDPTTEKSFEKKLKKDELTKSEFYRRAKLAYLQGRPSQEVSKQ